MICGSTRSICSRSRAAGARGALDRVDLVEGDDDRAPFALDEIGDPGVLLFERRLRIDENDHHLGEPDGVERIGDRQLLELFLDARATPHPGGIVDAHAAGRAR